MFLVRVVNALRYIQYSLTSGKVSLTWATGFDLQDDGDHDMLDSRQLPILTAEYKLQSNLEQRRHPILMAHPREGTMMHIGLLVPKERFPIHQIPRDVSQPGSIYIPHVFWPISSFLFVAGRSLRSECLSPVLHSSSFKPSRTGSFVHPRTPPLKNKGITPNKCIFCRSPRLFSRHVFSC